MTRDPIQELNEMCQRAEQKARIELKAEAFKEFFEDFDRRMADLETDELIKGVRGQIGRA